MTTEPLPLAPSLIRWHEYRPWEVVDPNGPQPATPDACGACGTEKALHPRPVLNHTGFDPTWGHGEAILALLAERDRYKEALEALARRSCPNPSNPCCQHTPRSQVWCASCIARTALTPPAPEQGDA